MAAELLETQDEHFYPAWFNKYYWPLRAFGLPDEVLRKLYRDNAVRLGFVGRSPN